MSLSQPLRIPERFKRLLWGVCLVAVVVAVWRLEGERASVDTRVLSTEAGSVTLYQPRSVADAPLVLVTHGFAGSRQMMQYIARDLARAGFSVASFDFFGQGRSTARMSADITRIEGTTRQLVRQTVAVLDALRADEALAGPAALVGHSMATDIIIRTAQEVPNIAAIVAISMYSDEVSPEFPQNLLIISGEWEERLRIHARAAMEMVGGPATEGVTVQNGDVTRRAVSADNTEHVAVLFAAQTMSETRDWILSAFELPEAGHLMPRGLEIAGLLIGLVVLTWPLARILPRSASPVSPLGWKPFCLAVLLPVPFAVGAALALPAGLFGSAGFGSLAIFYFVWGLVALAVLRRAGRRPETPRLDGALLLLIWGLAVFALALDRYAASFLPTGPRLPVMAVLLVACLPFMLADRMLVAGGALWQRFLARAVPIIALSATMILHPQNMGLLFTVLPVMVLFYLVYGSMARAVALRAGPTSAAVALAVILAYAIAASTPLFIA